jgi:hypothetical protein
MLAIALLLQAAVPAAATGAPPAGSSDLVSAALRERQHKQDRFARPVPDAQIAGRRFRISLRVIPVHTGELSTEGVPGFWDYDRVRQKLILDARQQMWPTIELMLNDDLKWGLDGFYVQYDLVAGRNYTRENFGARATIHKYTANAVGLAYPRSAIDDDAGLPQPKDVLGFHYAAEIPMSGDRARVVTATLRLIVEGQVTTFPDGGNVTCGTIEGEPSRTIRLDLATRYCLVAARFDRVSFQDAAGDVLAEWKR